LNVCIQQGVVQGAGCDDKPPLGGQLDEQQLDNSPCLQAQQALEGRTFKFWLRGRCDAARRCLCC
jgi:hypothetical protein